jgi:NAD(P)H-flavin reductase
LALKNTPLAFLTAYSYERLNILHQGAGYCTVLFAVLHAILYIVTDAKIASLSDLLELEQIMGIVAGLAMLSMLTTALALRRIQYEAFYIVHIVMYILVIIAVGMHRPEFQTKSIFIVISAACIWGSDRLLRGFRIVLHAFGNHANVYPLAQGGIRIVLQRTPWRAVPGTHVFLWIPRVRAFETHPFTVVSTNPLEVVICSQDGFTRDLFSLASKRPGALLRASCDGPYGTLPNFEKFEHVVLIAGGSGATFAIGVALNLIHKLPSNEANPVIHFIWVTRDHGKISYHLSLDHTNNPFEMKNWFEKELAELRGSPLVKLTVYVTRTLNARTPASEKQASEQAIDQAPSFEKSEAHITDPEKSASGSGSPTTSQSSLAVLLGRPDISAAIRSIADATLEHEKTIVAACGPESLMQEARGVVADLVKSSGRSVTLHCEQFGW